MKMLSIDELKKTPGLRIVVVGAPSPWGQPEKAMMEYKRLNYSAGQLELGGANEEVVSWTGINSAPIVGWNDERPIDRWTEILFFA